MWPNLILFFVSFILTALFAPKPKLEDAKAESLDSDNFPKASEDSPVPLLLGRALVKGPNTIFYGDFVTVPVTEKIKTSIFSSKKVIVGYKYYLTLDLALCLGPCTLHDIIIDDVRVLSGDEVEFDPIRWSGTIPIIMGTSSQELNLGSLGLSQGDIDASGMKFRIQGAVDCRLFGLGGSGPAWSYFEVKFIFLDESGTVISSILSRDSKSGAISLDLEAAVPVGTAKVVYQTTFSPLFPIFSYNAGGSTCEVKMTGLLPLVTHFEIYEPELFGGKKQGGGWIGNFTFYPGSTEQDPDPDLELLLGVGQIPGYNGVSHIVMPKNYIGETPSLRAMSFDLSSYTDRLGLPGHGKIGQDINPAEAIAEMILNKWRGLGRKESSINVASFQEAGTVLHAEENGVSILVTSGQTGKEVISEVLRQVDGMLYQDLESQEFNFKLIRRDYDLSDLQHFGPSEIVSLTSFTKTTWADVYAQVKVSFSSREKDTSLTAVAQDMAISNMKDGELKTLSLSFPMCYDANTANELAARELSRYSVPIFKFSIEINRKAYKIKSGEPFKISYPEYGLYNVVVRAQEANLGTLGNNTIVVTVVQDVFAVADTVLAPPTSSSWQDYERIPPKVAIGFPEEIPMYFYDQLGFTIADTQSYPIYIPKKPSPSSTFFTVWSGPDDVTLETADPQEVEYPLFGQLLTVISESDGYTTGALPDFDISFDPFYGAIDFPTPDGHVLYCGGEWFSFETAIQTDVTKITLTGVRRAVMGSMPKNHLIGEYIFFVSTSIVGSGDASEVFSDEDEVFYIIQNRNANAIRELERDTVSSFSTNSGLKRPSRPRNLTMDGTRSFSSTILSTDMIKDVAWSASNKWSLEEELDASSTPVETEEYVIEVIVDGSIQDTFVQSGLTRTIDFAAYDGVGGQLRVYSRRTDNSFRSSGYAFTNFLLGESLLLLSGDESGTGGAQALSGDMTSGTDRMKLSGG